MIPEPTLHGGQAAPAGDALVLSGAMQSHPGLARPSNEDATAYVLPAPGSAFARNGSLALVADGVGGHAAGEVASRLAADTVRRTFYDRAGTVPDVLGACFEAANRVIHERSRSDPSCAGMATTCTAVAVRDGLAYLAHVGDSRAYLLREGRLRQISQDHSVVADLLRRGTITPEEATRSPYRSLILRALGRAPTVAALVWTEGLRLQPGDRIILCSDGLSDLVDDAAIAHAAATLDPLAACRALVAEALRNGGGDNVSLGVFAVEEQAAASPSPDEATRLVAIDLRHGDPRRGTPG